MAQYLRTVYFYFETDYQVQIWHLLIWRRRHFHRVYGRIRFISIKTSFAFLNWLRYFCDLHIHISIYYWQPWCNFFQHVQLKKSQKNKNVIGKIVTAYILAYSGLVQLFPFPAPTMINLYLHFYDNNNL